MEKQISIEFDGVDNYYSIILNNSVTLEKNASSLSDEVSKFIETHNFDTSKYLYVLINALGSEEFYGPNKNGDAFPEYYEGKPNLLNDGTDYGYKTFEYHAKLYKHHINKDPEKSYGDVLLSVYNPRMHRVELVVRMDRSKAPEEVAKVERGEVLSTSMGTKVPYDVCSICGNKAKTRAQYCYHLKNMMNKILPNGKKVYAINPKPKFFDISMVFVPADETSRVIKKIANAKYAIENKKAEIKKEVPAQGIESTSIDDIISKLIKRKFDEMDSRSPDIPADELNHLAKFPLRRVLASMLISGIKPKPREFQRIILVRMGKPDMADMLDRQNLVFNRSKYDLDPDVLSTNLKLQPDHADKKIVILINRHIPLRSRWQPFLLRRLLGDTPCPMIKQATEDNVFPVMWAISGLYKIFEATAPTFLARALAGITGYNPALAALAVGANVLKAATDKSLATNIYSTGTTNAEELLKLSSINDSIHDLINSNFNLSKYASKRLAKDIASLGKFVFKDYAGFSGSSPSMWRRAVVGLPLISFASGLASAKRASNPSDNNVITDILAKHPGKLFILTTLLGHKVPGIFKKANYIDKIADTSSSVELLFRDGELLDVATLVKIGNLF